LLILPQTFLDEKVVGIYKDPEDAFEYIEQELKNEPVSINYRVEEFELK
jgi:S-adenosylmethionine/arginine decarboxylase-like enzyme